MDIEKLKDRLLEWDGVETVDNGQFTEVNYHGVFELLREAADALEQLQAENDRLKKERTQKQKICEVNALLIMISVDNLVNYTYIFNRKGK